MVAFVQADTHPNDTLTTLDDQHRRMEGRDGIREDYTGGAFAVTLSTTAPTLTVASAGRSILVDGNLLDFTGVTLNAVLDPRDTGTLPTGTQVRTDLVVARYDADVEVIAQRGRLVVKPGTPGGTASAPPGPPNLTREPGGTWEVPISSHVLPSAGLLTSKVDRRWWSGDHAYLSASSPLAALHGPVGCTRDLGGSLWRRRLAADGSPVWAQETALTEVFSSSRVTEANTFTRNETPDILVTAVDVPARSYPRVATLEGAALPTDFTSDSDYADAGFRVYRNGVLLSDRARRVRTSKRNVSVFLQRTFRLDADATYKVEWVAQAGGLTGAAASWSANPTFTYLDVATRWGSSS